MSDREFIYNWIQVFVFVFTVTGLAFSFFNPDKFPVPLIIILVTLVLVTGWGIGYTLLEHVEIRNSVKRKAIAVLIVGLVVTIVTYGILYSNVILFIFVTGWFVPIGMLLFILFSVLYAWFEYYRD